MDRQQPNIILINCDDLGYGDLGSYGSKINKTPHLDKLASEGLRFTDFYMASSVCSPSRAAMMTGCYPPRVGINRVLFPGDEIGLNPNEITIAKLLQQNGYNTKIVGKWHVGDQKEFLPTEHGFDDYFGIPYSNDMGRQKARTGQVSKHPPLPLVRGNEVHQEQPDQRGLTERYTDECVQFIKANQSKPFFLYMAHMYVHVPLFVPDQFLKASNNGAYGGAVAEIDWSTGVIMDTLKKIGLDENTIVIFTSDNGSRAQGEGGSNAPCKSQKGTIWEGGYRVPCIVRWPDKIKANSVQTGMATSMDLYPTLAKLTQCEIPTDRVIDGIDLSETILNEAPSPREDFAYHFHNKLFAVRKGQWKLHLTLKRGWNTDAVKDINQLYDLTNDIGETNDVSKDHPQIVKELLELAQQYRIKLGDELTETKGTDLREVGFSKNPVALTSYDKDHPYIVAMYDNADSKTMAG